MPEWMTPLLWPVWCQARSGSFSRTTTERLGEAEKDFPGGRQAEDAAADYGYVEVAGHTDFFTPGIYRRRETGPR